MTRRHGDGERQMLEPMLSVEEAQERVLSAFEPLGTERVPILEATGRVLAEDVHADIDIPPHANSSMDGYAVRAADTAGAGPKSPGRLRVIADLPAGYVPEQEVTPGTAVRIMTGAPLPPGADAVVKVEDTAMDGEHVSVFAAVEPGNYVRPAGEDVRQGVLVLGRGTRLRPQEVGMLAALGRQEVSVGRRPRVAILATGDELVAIDQPLAPGKIRNTNSYANAAQVIEHGGEPILLGIARDTVEELTAKIQAGLDQDVDLFLTSGGVSVGDFDLVKDVLAAEGEMNFWRVRMKPGKPLAFGHLNLPPHGGESSRKVSESAPSPRLGGVEGGIDHNSRPEACTEFSRSDGAPSTFRESSGDRGGEPIPILGLPGNPVSVMVSFETFVRPALLTMQGMTDWRRPTVEATLMDEIPHKDERRHFVRVQLRWKDGAYHAYLTGAQGSGILSSMLKANALAIIPEEWDHAPAGARVDVLMLD